MLFSCGSYQIDLAQPRVMGIVNVTPDSFSDGGQFYLAEKAVAHALQLVQEGAAILDVGGESTRPGAQAVPLQQELDRVIPVIEQLSKLTQVPISVDTYKPQVMQAAIAAGATIVNDVCALQNGNALQIVAASNVGVCLMHMQGSPQTMQLDPHYTNVVIEVREFLQQRLQAALDAGITANRILLDPGFGFGKRTADNLDLLAGMPSIAALGQPLLVGLSRKSVLGKLVGAGVDERLHASLAASVVAVMKGAQIVRVHDVKATVDALKVAAAVLNHPYKESS